MDSRSQSEDFPYKDRHTSNVDPSILCTVYAKEKRRRLEEMDALRENLEKIFPNFATEFGETLDDFIIEQTKKTLDNLKDKVYGKADSQSPNECTHLWIGVNPPPNTTSMKCLWEQALVAFEKYKCLATHASCVEAHTEGGHRPHLHILAMSKEKPGRVITALANHFSLKKNSIECKAYHKGLLFGEHYDYIIGSKKTSKQKNVDLDKSERAENEIPDFLQNIFSDNIKNDKWRSPEEEERSLDLTDELNDEDPVNLVLVKNTL